MTHYNTILKDSAQNICLSAEDIDSIAEIVAKLQEAVNLATNDFLLVAAFIRNISDRSKLTNSTSLGKEVSGIITELQYVDALKQRIDHIVFFLEEINLLKNPGKHFSAEEINNFQKTCGLIFQLNFYQLKVAKADFVKSVEKIEAGLVALKAQPDGVALFDVEPKDIFNYSSEVTATLHEVALLLIRLSSSFPVNSEVRSLSIIRHLLSQYTMESEREVLRWCMNYMEDNSIGELKIDDSKGDQIQLF